MSQSVAHSRLVQDILIELGSDPRWRIWKNPVGTALTLDGKRVVRYGVEGSPDLYVLVQGGMLGGLEVKTGKGIQSGPQKKFMVMMRQFGAFYGVVHSVSEARNLLSSWVKIASES